MNLQYRNSIVSVKVKLTIAKKKRICLKIALHNVTCYMGCQGWLFVFTFNQNLNLHTLCEVLLISFMFCYI